MNGSFAGTLKFPPIEGQADCSLPVSAAFSYTKKFEFEDEVTGSGTVTLSFSNMAPDGAKYVQVMYKSSTAATATPILVKFNSGTETEQLHVGGLKIHYNPTPSAAGGILSIEIDHTDNAEIHVLAFA